MLQKNLTPFVLSIALLTSSFAQADYEVVPDSQVTHEIAPGSIQAFSSKMSILVWNVFKGESETAWAQDMRELTKTRSLVFLQESVDDNFMMSVLRSIPSLGWLLARSFYMDTNRSATGVITGSAQTPLSSVFLRSRDREPFLNTPKMTLLTTYMMEDGSRLLAVNIHAINFRPSEAFYRQIDDIMGILKKWEGKIIFAGDFNTWAPARLEYLKKRTSSIGLKHVAFGRDPRRLILDHIFVRGCLPYGSEVRSDIQTSDHWPLTTHLLCEK